MTRGCTLGFQPACVNVTTPGGDGNWARETPPLSELRILLRGSKAPIVDWSAEELYTRACQQGWADSCGRVANAGSH